MTQHGQTDQGKAGQRVAFRLVLGEEQVGQRVEGVVGFVVHDKPLVMSEQ